MACDLRLGSEVVKVGTSTRARACAGAGRGNGGMLVEGCIGSPSQGADHLSQLRGCRTAKSPRCRIISAMRQCLFLGGKLTLRQSVSHGAATPGTLRRGNGNE